jgi:hypothetical protein
VRKKATLTTVAVASSSVAADALWTSSTWKIVDKLNDDHLEQCRKAKKTVVNLFAK